ncbi:hypothetical protein PCORN_08877 [Listeria cornellensis FSL F6-0969]|uniref:Uncharacterized protein n=1 Tax=Listeria cornellensis FSL F6-0969 TaxID=1265820 RepID=W7C3H1_9LIST|nr:hypothetical protein [Listeria cornellensis]EUJ30206.1 hypothetical protein PCORN_08877 [Listeria cornellensis FSL F6-0969]
MGIVWILVVSSGFLVFLSEKVSIGIRQIACTTKNGTWCYMGEITEKWADNGALQGMCIAIPFSDFF